MLQSHRLMAMLMGCFAIALAAGTFIEHGYNTATARILVYNAWWFEGLMLLMVFNFVLNIRRHGLLRRQKFPVLLLHLALVLIILGAFITRYYGMEGLLSVREGESSDEVITENTFVKVTAEYHQGDTLFRKTIEHPVLLSQATPGANSFRISDEFMGRRLEVAYGGFTENAAPYFRESPDGLEYLEIVEASQGERKSSFLRSGAVLKLGDTFFAYNQPTPDAINITTRGAHLFIEAPFDGKLLQMSAREERRLAANTPDTLYHKALYVLNSIPFTIPEPPKRGFPGARAVKPTTGKELPDALQLQLKTADTDRAITVFGKKQALGEPYTTLINGITYTLSYGSKIHKLPFQLKLNDFIAEKYPGSQNSYAAFKSKVDVLGPGGTVNAEIYMNHVLDYQGYRFFQASFHPDEKGTILSVNRDAPGTWTTYVGYFLLYLGLLLTLFSRHSRFRKVSKSLTRLYHPKVRVLLACTILWGWPQEGRAQTPPSPLLVKTQIDSILSAHKVPQPHALAFGKLVVQDQNGRMKPLNTFASELLRKLSKRNSYNDLTADQTLISIMQFPELWYNVPLIYVKKGNDSIRKILQVPGDIRHLPLASFFDQEGAYKLEARVKQAYQLVVPDRFAKDFIETDRRVHLLYDALSGRNLKIFPVPGDPNNTWLSANAFKEKGLGLRDTVFVGQVLPYYFQSLEEARESGQYDKAQTILEKIGKYQLKYGKEVHPGASKINAEVLYNKLAPFNHLFLAYLLAGSLMLLFAIVSFFHQSRGIRFILKSLRISIVLCLLLHSGGLAFRAYISGHAPWSDAYETMIYIGWATMLIGLFLSRTSYLALGATAFVVSILLMVAHWNWLDPAIANLQPVLNSYWLMIHVAIIVASYGPFTLGMVLGLICLFLMVFINARNQERMKAQIRKLTLTSELALTLGLVMLTIGNFLGGQWANESWGRYWAWDPKETWALVSIMLYAFIIHMRLVPRLRGAWVFSMMSVLGYYAILMTYFGVNFYLSGLHSYAKGDHLLTPGIVTYSLLGFLLLGTVSYVRQRPYL